MSGSARQVGGLAPARRGLFGVVLVLVVLAVMPAWAREIPLAPQQPPVGPGGAWVEHRGIRQTEVGVGEDKFFLFEPLRPEPGMTRVIVLLHSAFYGHPYYYLGWIEHLVQRGDIVIFPCYQGTGDPMSRWLDNVARSLLHAYKVLKSPHHVAPDPRRLAVFGHGCGATLAANLAVLATPYGLPQPRALLLANPSLGAGSANAGLPLARHDTIPLGTVLAVVVGEDDRKAEWETARDLYYRASSLRSDDKVFITLRTDNRGKPGLMADHQALCSPIRREGERDIDRRRYEYVQLHPDRFFARILRGADRDALEYYGYWKIADGLLDAAFGDGKARIAALGEGEYLRSIGQHSDGVPATPLLSSERP